MNSPDAKLPAGSRYCLCRECGRYFKSPHAFEQHRLGDMGARRCATDAELAEMGLSPSRLGYWRVEGTGWHSDMGDASKSANSLDVDAASLGIDTLPAAEPSAFDIALRP